MKGKTIVKSLCRGYKKRNDTKGIRIQRMFFGGRVDLVVCKLAQNNVMKSMGSGYRGYLR